MQLNYAWSFSDLQDSTVQKAVNQVVVVTPSRLLVDYSGNVSNLPVDSSSVSSSSKTDDGSHLSSGNTISCH